MIVTQQMKNAMDKKKINLLLEGKISSRGVSLRCFQRNNDIAHDFRIDVAVFSFLHGKGYNVRGLVSAQVVMIQPLNGFVIREDDAYFFICTVENFENSGNRSADFSLVDFIQGLSVFDLYFHESLSCRCLPFARVQDNRRDDEKSP